MPREPVVGQWTSIIEAVTSIMGLTALAILAAGAAFTAALVKTPSDSQFLTFGVMIALVCILVISNMIYAYVMQRHELTFRVRVARVEDGVESPCEDFRVDLYKNDDLVQSSSTDEMGMLSFTVKLDRKDELYVIIIDSTGAESNRAAIYSAGQCQMIKTIRL